MTKKILLITFTFILTIKLGLSQEITELNTSINGVLYGETKWIDVDNDNVYEFIVTGNSGNSQYTAIASYNGSEFILDTSNTFTQIGNASLDTADFNSDGFMDFIITGYDGTFDKTYIYMNDGYDQFIEQETNILGITFGKVRVADLNNDNRPDVVITGSANGTYNAKLYLQDAQGNFVDSNTILMANYFGDITFIDANNDDQLDILLTGFDLSYMPNTKLYINSNGVFTEAAEQSIHPYYFTATDVADLDNDGDDDLVLSGLNSTYNVETAVFINDGTGSFTKNTTISNTLDQVYFGDLNLVDYNNDGHLDIFSTGQDSSGSYISKLYINDGENNFVLNTDVTNTITGVAISSSDWIDFDNDGDMDLTLVGLSGDGSAVASIYRNETVTLTINDNSLSDIRIYPNPASDVLYLQSNNIIQEVIVTNVLGENVSVISNKNKLIVSELMDGLYILRIKDVNDQESVFKFIKK